MIRIICFIAILAVGVGAASAEPYWIAYEGNDFPENEGWWHIWGGGTAERSIEDGVFVLNTLHDPHIADFYQMNMYGGLDPEPGETFIMQWRLCVDEASGEDIDIAVFSDERWAAGFMFDADSVRSGFESGVGATFEPGIYHDFEFRSTDMRSYQLFIDGELAVEGALWLSLTESQVGWGDGAQGSASLSYWDYFRFGVVPEPTAGLAMGVLLALASHRRSRSHAR